jgi:hypothetical protein
MKNFFAGVGVWFCIMFTLGSIDVIDFHICAKSPGACSK